MARKIGTIQKSNSGTVVGGGFRVTAIVDLDEPLSSADADAIDAGRATIENYWGQFAPRNVIEGRPTLVVQIEAPQRRPGDFERAQAIADEIAGKAFTV